MADKLEEFINHCAYGDEEAVIDMLEHDKFDINQQNKEGETALTAAVKNKHDGVVQILLEDDADINAQDGEGNTPLIIAIYNNDKDIFKQLIQNDEIDINLANADGWTALMIAVDRGNTYIVKKLLNEGAMPNQKNKNGETSLLIAARIGNSGIVKLLIAHGADRNVKNALGQTPAMITKNPDIKQIFKEICTFNPDFFEEQENLGCGRHAINNLLGGLFTIKDNGLMITGKNIDKLDCPIPLMSLCRYLEIKGRLGNGIKQKNGTIVYCPKNENYEDEVLKAALNILGYNVALVNTTNIPRDVPPGMVGYLLNLGGGHWVSIRYTPEGYRWIDSMRPNYTPIINLSDIENKLKENMRNSLYRVSLAGHFINPLLDAPVIEAPATSAPAAAPATSSVAASSASASAPATSSAARPNYTPLMVAIRNKNLDEVRRLLATPGIDINQTINFGNGTGITALMVAVVGENLAIIQELLKHRNINVFERAGNGDSALILSIRIKNINIFKELIKRYIYYPYQLLSEKTNNGRTLLALAVEYNQLDMVKLILDYLKNIRFNDIEKLIKSINSTDYNKNPDIKQLLDDKMKELVLAQLFKLAATKKINLQRETQNYLPRKFNNLLLTLINYKLHNITINTPDENGNTLLIISSKSGSVSSVKDLLNNGANPLIKNKEGKTAIDVAATDEIRNLLQKAINSASVSGSAPAPVGDAAPAPSPSLSSTSKRPRNNINTTNTRKRQRLSSIEENSTSNKRSEAWQRIKIAQEALDKLSETMTKESQDKFVKEIQELIKFFNNLSPNIHKNDIENQIKSMISDGRAIIKQEINSKRAKHDFIIQKESKSKEPVKSLRAKSKVKYNETKRINPKINNNNNALESNFINKQQTKVKKYNVSQATLKKSVPEKVSECVII